MSTPPDYLEEVTEALSRSVEDWQILSSAEDQQYTVDNVRPRLLCRPKNVEETVRAVSAVARQKAALIPRGGGTKMHLGQPPQRADVVMLMTNMREVISYEPSDLTVTVQAGIRLDDLNSILSQHRQFLPLDPPFSDRATVGGVVSSNCSGPLRLGYGASRELLLGLTAVYGDGKVSTFGSRVLHSTAGYEVHKLYVGAVGTLGIAGSMSMRVYPLPQAEETLAAVFADFTAAHSFASSLIRSAYAPVSLVIMNEPAMKKIGETLPLQFPLSPVVVAVKVGGWISSIHLRLDYISALGREHGAREIYHLKEEETAPFWKAIQNHPKNIGGMRESDVTFGPILANASALLKITTPIGRVSELVEVVRQISDQNWGEATPVLSMAGSGITYVYLPAIDVADSIDINRFALVTYSLRQYVQKMRGGLVIEACNPELKNMVDVWGDVAPPALALMRKIKQQFDSAGIFSPGRFVGGI